MTKLTPDDKHVPRLDELADTGATMDKDEAFRIVAAVCMQALGIGADQFGRDYQEQNLTQDKVWTALVTVRYAVENVRTVDRYSFDL